MTTNYAVPPESQTAPGNTQPPITTIDRLLKHISPGSIKEIGCGSYARVYKMEYTRCQEPAENCRFCLKIPPEIHQICVKQLYMSSLYDQDDYECEITYQQLVYNKYPGLVVRIYDHWLHDDITIPELHPPILEQPPGSAKGDSILQTGFILCELMPDLDLHSYLKQVSLPTYHLEQPGPRQYIHMLGLIFILVHLVYILHYEFGITHGDFRDRNIFLKYHNPDWRQQCSGGYLGNQQIEINTGGWEIKLGDFGLADKIIEGEGSFIIRDYEFLDNIYCLRQKWRHTCSGADFNNLILFIKREFLEDIYDRINKYRRDGQSITDARHTFWFNKHRVSPNSIFQYELPQRLVVKISELFPRNYFPWTSV